MPDAPYVKNVTDPWQELDDERRAHATTLAKFQAVWQRAQVMDGRSAMSSRICKLCQEIPMGRNLAYRSQCPLHTSMADVEKEAKRLAKPYRRNASSKAANAPQEARARTASAG